MTDLEKHIIQAARERISRFTNDELEKLDTCKGQIEIPFMVDGVFDSLVYDPKKQKFIGVRYSKVISNPKGTLMNDEFMSDYTCMADPDDIQNNFIAL